MCGEHLHREAVHHARHSGPTAGKAPTAARSQQRGAFLFFVCFKKVPMHIFGYAQKLQADTQSAERALHKATRSPGLEAG